MKKWLWPLLLALPFSAAAERIVAIGGDVTEIISALGAEKELVARDSTSLRPDSVRALPDVGYMRQLNAEGIMAMEPTLVIASDLSQPSLVLQQVADSGTPLVRVPAQQTLTSVPLKISVIAKALGREAEGQALIEKYRRQLAGLNDSPLPVKALFVMSHGGMVAMAAGQNTAADVVIRAAGLQNAMRGVSRYQPLSQEGTIASAPDLLLISAEGLRALGGEQQVWRLPGLALTPAGKNRRLLLVDDMALLGFTLDTPALLLELRKAAEQIP